LYLDEETLGGEERGAVPVITSVINLKGGVGKTTLTVALAHYLAVEHQRRVLVVDLDPQTNATVCLIPEHDWKARDARGQTLYGLYRDLLQGTCEFHPAQAIVPNVSNVGGGVHGLDLLPCSIRLISIQDEVTRLAQPGAALSAPVTALRDALAEVLAGYDHVLMDCPPALGVITQSGLLLSDGFLVPVVPDILSLQGVVPVLDLIATFARRAGRTVTPIGTVVSKYNPRNRLHARILEELRRGSRGGTYPPLFETLVPESAPIAEAADIYARVRTLRQKYRSADATLSALTREFLVRAERARGVAEIAELDRTARDAFARRLAHMQPARRTGGPA
jgi:chromosome partitioning protein